MELQRCNWCMHTFDEQRTECPYCGSDEWLMFPYEPLQEDINEW